MPVSILESVGAPPGGDDRIVAICQFCGQKVYEFENYLYETITREQERTAHKELFYHEENCMDNPDTNRSCDNCDEHLHFMGDHCVANSKNFETRDGKSCALWKYKEHTYPFNLS